MVVVHVVVHVDEVHVDVVVQVEVVVHAVGGHVDEVDVDADVHVEDHEEGHEKSQEELDHVEEDEEEGWFVQVEPVQSHQLAPDSCEFWGQVHSLDEEAGEGCEDVRVEDSRGAAPTPR